MCLVTDNPQGRIIKRTAEFPWKTITENQSRKNCRHKFSFFIQNNVQVDVRYSRSRWRKIGEDDCPVKRRTIFAWLIKQNQSVGALEFNEYDVGPFVYDDDFFQVLDDNSSVEAEMAKAACSCWEDIGEEIASYGTILDFHRAWMHPPAARHSLWAVAARQIMDREFGQIALLLMKAFPLEYEGEITSFNRKAFMRRRAAMIRHYARLFDVSPMPGQAGQEGWLFSIPRRLRLIMTEPRVLEGREFEKI